mmetsp:Transcript_34509/g.97783  ORF Transcript_34509/g.97783 Transcript_34509/m.97783 type:complete len:411 (-) Transcript_34509:71-1303(-)
MDSGLGVRLAPLDDRPAAGFDDASERFCRRRLQLPIEQHGKAFKGPCREGVAPKPPVPWGTLANELSITALADLQLEVCLLLQVALHEADVEELAAEQPRAGRHARKALLTPPQLRHDQVGDLVVPGMGIRLPGLGGSQLVDRIRVPAFCLCVEAAERQAGRAIHGSMDSSGGSGDPWCCRRLLCLLGRQPPLIRCFGLAATGSLCSCRHLLSSSMDSFACMSHLLFHHFLLLLCPPFSTAIVSFRIASHSCTPPPPPRAASTTRRPGLLHVQHLPQLLILSGLVVVPHQVASLLSAAPFRRLLLFSFSRSGILASCLPAAPSAVDGVCSALALVVVIGRVQTKERVSRYLGAGPREGPSAGARRQGAAAKQLLCEGAALPELPGPGAGVPHLCSCSASLRSLLCFRLLC